MSLKEAFALCSIVTSLAVSPVLALDPAVPSGYGLVWQDEFNGAALNSDIWQTWYNDNSYSVGNGALNMAVYTDPVTGANHCAYIATQVNGMYGYDQTYGYFVARMKFHDRSGTSSAFWMSSPTMWADNTDPAVSGTEIDVIEHWQQDSSGMVNNKAHETVWGPYNGGQNIGHQTANLGLDDGNFHLIALLWTPTSYKFYVDNTLQWTCTHLLSQRSEFFLLDLYENNTQDYGPLGSVNNAELTVDYVRAYATPEPRSFVVLATGAIGLLAYARIARSRKLAVRRIRNI